MSIPASSSPQTSLISLEFFEPAIAVLNLHGNTSGIMHTCVPQLEALLREHLSPGSEYQLIFNPIPKRDDSFAPEDIAAIKLHMQSLSSHFSCRATYFIMNEGLHYQINRAMAEPFSTQGVFRAASLGDAIRQIEKSLGAEIIFDHIPVSCC